MRLYVLCEKINTLKNMKKKDIKRFDLDKPFNPADIKGLKVNELEQLSSLLAAQKMVVTLLVP